MRPGILLFLSSIVSIFLNGQIPPATESFRLLNTSFDEQNPVLSPDGKTIYFTISNHPQNVGGKKDPGDIWFSRLLGTEWSAPIHAGLLLNDRAYNAVAGISSDGQQLFLHGHYDPAGTAKTQGISVSRNEGSGWSRPENITIPYFQNKSGAFSGMLSSDNSVFVFSAETYGTRGVDDIYVSRFEDGKWSEPKNLGSVINTQFQELSPSISIDKKTIYFSSNGRRGSGSFDVYAATRLDDSWTSWSEPENLGTAVNSEGRELFFRPYFESGFALYTTTKNSDGYGDIKVYRIEEPFAKKDTAIMLAAQADTTVRIVEVKRNPELGDVKILKIYGQVTNAKTGEPIAAKIAFASPGKQDLSTNSSSSGYMVNVPSTEMYTIRIEAAGYVSALEKLDVNTYQMRELEMNFKLQPVAIGTTVNLKSVLFVQTKTDILPESFSELDLVVNFLKENPNVTIELAGHTDNRGNHSDNVRLSQQRVNKVKAYLVSKGISAKRITGKGYGGLKPIASNDTEESRRMNRRVEFVIKKF